MPRKTKVGADQGPPFWEADQMDLQAVVDRRLNPDAGKSREPESREPAWFAAAFAAPWSIASGDVDRPLNADDGSPSEPAWFSATFDASWPLVFAEAGAEAWRT